METSESKASLVPGNTCVYLNKHSPGSALGKCSWSLRAGSHLDRSQLQRGHGEQDLGAPCCV